ncbi:ABC transporter substrate-binding protein [Burkholderia sp. SRS-W-2-2016]|uniref:ABC transporter substrate-binding protein n=1 Tax=Burkholderia sp. SRS-W-2-2016 TaxID=1926878 RepID=UPI00094B031E|nr:ABC transporter substrate-binding protein [Burkholderia sp. SRS-W-2-2016]OLL31251.1 ABC transporter substrate-binding protein [Burkholderia sp. SRS-W-2-2016]
MKDQPKQTETIHDTTHDTAPGATTGGGITRRAWLATAGKTLASGAAVLAAPAIVRAQGEQPLKLGLLMAKQGVWTEQGEVIANGVKLALDDANNQARGRRLELVWYDEPNPQSAQQNMQKLVEQDKVIAVIGGTNSGTSLAMSSVANRTKTPYIAPNAAARELTGSSCNPYTFRVLSPTPVTCRALAPSLLAIGKKWHFLVANYAYGQDIQRSMSELLKQSGGTMTGADVTPLNTTDFSSFILKIRQSKPDVVLLGLPGGDLSTFLKQYAEMGMKDKIPVACPIIGDSDLWSISADAATGYYGKPWHFSAPGHSPEEIAFIKKYTAKYGKPPADKAWIGWFTTRALLAGVNQAKSTSGQDIVQSLETVQFGDSSGPAYFRPWDHQMLRRWTVFKVKDHIADKWDWLDQVSAVPQNPAELDKLYGSKQEIGCTMAAR